MAPGARLFGTSTDEVRFASDATIDDYQDSTQIFWLYLPTGTGGFRLPSWKGITGNSSLASLSVQITNTHKIAAFFRNSGGAYDTVATDAVLTEDSYVYLVVRQRKDPAAIEILVGDVDNAAAEGTYETESIAGTSPLANAGQPFILGSGDGTATGLHFPGRISLFSYWNRWLTDAEIEDMRSRDRPPDDDLPGIWVDLGVIVGDQVTNFGTGPDGTLTGTTEADGVVLPPRPVEESTTVALYDGGRWQWR